MNDDTRVALRALARQAEWGTARGGAAAEAARLRELGRALAARLAAGDAAASGDVETDGGGPDEQGWAYRSVSRLAEHCKAADPAWSAEKTAELSRLREDAVIALAPGPGQSDPGGESSSRPRGLAGVVGAASAAARIRNLPLPRGRRGAAALAAVGCAVVVAVVLALVGGGGHGHAGAASTTPTQGADQRTDAPPTTATQPTDTQSASPTASGSDTTAATADASPSESVSTPVVGGTSPVTAIDVTFAPAGGDGYPEVQIYAAGTASDDITASSTAPFTLTVTVTGKSGNPSTADTQNFSGQLSYLYVNTIQLRPWCGQGTVTVTVFSGKAKQAGSVPVPAC